MRYLVMTLLVGMLSLAGFAQVSTRVESPVIEALARGDVYVAPELLTTVDQARLQKVANDLKPFTVKFVVVPLQDRNARGAWASGLRRQLNVREGAVIVLTPQMPGLRGGVVASSDVIPPQDITRIVQANVSAFTVQGYTQGLEKLARALRDHYVAERRGAVVNTGLLIGVPAVLVLGAVGWVVRRRAREIARLKARLQEMRARLLEGIEYLDGYMDVLPEGEDASRAREHRQRAAELHSQAAELIDQAKRPEDLWRAEHLLDKASMSVEKAKKYILRAGGDTSIQVEEEPEEPLASEAAVTVRPNDRTYACFFCSKPPTLGELQPVEVTIGDQTRKVWACEECAEHLRRGETPPMRVIRDGDRMRPWYEDPNYDPYRDYGRPYPGMDWVTLLLLGNIFSHSAPVIIHEHAPVGTGDPGDNMDAGGVDWLGTDRDTMTEDAGGTDFDFGGDWGSDAGGADFDFGGDWGSDAGGADFDFGGDFGGGDFGGGDF